MIILFTIFASSFVIALSGALIPGPLLTATISESSRRGFITGPLMIGGHAILELALVIALLMGLAPFFQQPVVFMATAIALWQGWNLIPVSIYSFFAGIDAIIVGIRLYSLNLGQEPLVAAIGFVLAGLGGVGAFPFLQWFKDNKAVRWLAVAVLLVTAAIWAFTFYGALWAHMASFAKWVPATMATPAK